MKNNNQSLNYGIEPPAEGALLAPNQLRALEALLAGATTIEAAQCAGVNRTTLYRWRQDNPGFIAEYNRLRQEQKETGKAKLAQLQTKALDALADMLANPEAPGRLGAVKLVLEATGALEPDRIGPTDPRRVEAELREREQDNHLIGLGWRLPNCKN